MASNPKEATEQKRDQGAPAARTATHTPGPWRADRCRDRSDGWNVYAADTTEHASTGDVVVVADYLTEGNAKLIAAAIDLLSAAEGLVSGCPSCAGKGEYLVARGSHEPKLIVGCETCRPFRAALRLAGRLP